MADDAQGASTRFENAVRTLPVNAQSFFGPVKQGHFVGDVAAADFQRLTVLSDRPSSLAASLIAMTVTRCHGAI